jgi:hypothetical protein
MSPDTWAAIAHDDEQRAISAIFAACQESVGLMKGLSHKDVGV